MGVRGEYRVKLTEGDNAIPLDEVIESVIHLFEGIFVTGEGLIDKSFLDQEPTKEDWEKYGERAKRILEDSND